MATARCISSCARAISLTLSLSLSLSLLSHNSTWQVTAGRRRLLHNARWQGRGGRRRLLQNARWQGRAQAATNSGMNTLGFPLPFLMSTGSAPVMSITVDPSATCQYKPCFSAIPPLHHNPSLPQGFLGWTSHELPTAARNVSCRTISFFLRNIHGNPQYDAVFMVCH
jgi:hypothetical protein